MELTDVIAKLSFMQYTRNAEILINTIDETLDIK